MSDFLEKLFAARTDDSPGINNVKAVYAALKSLDLVTLSKLLTDRPVWDVTSGFPQGGVYEGMSGVFDGFYRELLTHVHTLGAYPQAFVDAGDIVVALGCYRVRAEKHDEPSIVRFAHVWGIDSDGRIKGVWQVADSAMFPKS